jgi:hypothetical protein
MRLLPRTEPSGHRFDLWSAVLCALMFGSLISGINGLGHGQAALAVAGEFIGAAATGYLLVRRQAAQAMPLLPIDLFRRPIFAVSVTTSVLCFIAQGLAFARAVDRRGDGCPRLRRQRGRSWRRHRARSEHTAPRQKRQCSNGGSCC